MKTAYHFYKVILFPSGFIVDQNKFLTQDSQFDQTQVNKTGKNSETLLNTSKDGDKKLFAIQFHIKNDFIDIQTKNIKINLEIIMNFAQVLMEDMKKQFYYYPIIFQREPLSQIQKDSFLNQYYPRFQKLMKTDILNKLLNII